MQYLFKQKVPLFFYPSEVRLQKKKIASPMYEKYLGKMSSDLETGMLNRSVMKKKTDWVKTCSSGDWFIGLGDGSE